MITSKMAPIDSAEFTPSIVDQEGKLGDLIKVYVIRAAVTEHCLPSFPWVLLNTVQEYGPRHV